MIKVSQLKYGDFPQEFIDVIPVNCDACGAENVLTDTLTKLECSNPKCKEKGVQRLVQMLKDIGLKNMGESKCRSMMEHFECFNPYCIFTYEPDEDGPLFEGCSMEFSYSIYEQVNKYRNMMLWEYVKIGNIPGIRDSARHLFKEYEDLETFYDDLEDGEVEFVQDLLGIKGKSVGDEEDVSVKAISIYEALVMFKDELFEFIDKVNIKNVNKVMNVCISDSAGGDWKTKSEYKEYMNTQYADVIHINFLSSVTKDCDYLIWGKSGAKTSKVKKAEKYGIEIVTGDELIEIIENEYI